MAAYTSTSTLTPLSLGDAALLSNNQLVAGVVEEIIEKDELFARLPFVPVNGKAYVYNRELSISEGDFLGPNGDVNSAGATFAEVTANLRALIGDVDVDKFIEATMGDTNSQRAIQIAAKAKGLGRKFHRTLIQGNSSDATQASTYDVNSFDGLHRIMQAIQASIGINAAGGAAADPMSEGQQADATGVFAGSGTGTLSWGIMDQLNDMVKLGADAIIMRRGTIRAYRNLVRSLGGVLADSVIIGNFGQPILAHNGVPILINDFMPIEGADGKAWTAGTKCTSIWAARFNAADGLHGLYGGSDAGIVIEDLGTVQNRDATRTRLKWYCGLALKSTRSLARITGITNV